MPVLSVSLVYLFLAGALAVAALSYYYARYDDRSHPSSSSLNHHVGNNSSVHSVAVVIPTLHEAAVLPATVTRLFLTANTASVPTVIVVDAGHCQHTSAVLEPLMAAHPTLHLVEYPGHPSRGSQLNLGAAHAATLAPQALILLFLHADSYLPLAWDNSIRTTLFSPHSSSLTLGAFTLSLPGSISFSTSPALRVMLWGANWRARWGGMPYGDQGYFLTRHTFDAVGGFPAVPIMEDVELLRRVSRWKGRVVVVDDAIETSPRRWERKGVFCNTALNQVLIAAWLCGLSHETIYRWYYGQRGKAAQS